MLIKKKECIPSLFGVIILTFQDWKDELEEKECCKFAKSFGATNGKNNEKTIYWQCNRSGCLRSKKKGQRRSKSSGEYIIS